MISERIGKYVDRGLRCLAALDPEALKSLSQEMGSMGSSLNFEATVQRLTSRLPNVDETEMAYMLNALVSWLAWKETTGVPLTELVNQIVEIALSKKIIESSDRAKFSATVESLLGDPGSLSITARALDVSSEYDKVFFEARILTDLRSVFLGDDVSRPKGMIVMHNLKISFSENGEKRDIYITLNNRELDELASVVERAQEKARGLGVLLNEVGILRIGEE